MEERAAKLLKVILDKCQGASVSEIRFVSGSNPAFVDEDGPHFLDVPDLSRELVSEINELCLSLTDDAAAKSKPPSSYTLTLRQFGRIHCKYQSRGNAASLVLVLDSDAGETIDAIRPKRPSSLRGEAKPDPDPKGQGH